VQIWIFLGGNVAYAVGLFAIWAIVTYFAGNHVGKNVAVTLGIPLWVELIALAVAACIVAFVAAFVCVLICAVLLAICGVVWLLAWPWKYRYQRLFREYIGFDSNLAKGLKYGSKWERRVDRRLKELAVAFQDALDKRTAAGDDDYNTWSLREAVNQARKSFTLAHKAAWECGFSTKRSHEYYLPKRRRVKLERVRNLQVVA